MTEQQITEFRDRIDIIQIISEHVPLHAQGINHVGTCPFCQGEGLTVNASKQFFYCFGCQKSGDVLRFLMDIEGKQLPDVVVMLLLKEAEKLTQASTADRAKFLLWAAPLLAPLLRVIEYPEERASQIDRLAASLGLSNIMAGKQR